MRNFAPALFLLALPACEFSGPKPFTILAVGESTTVQASPEGGWPQRLERALRAGCPGLDVHVQPWAVSGADSSDTVARLGAGLAIHHPGAVISMVGVNDHGDTLDATDADIAVFGAPYSTQAEMETATQRHVLEKDPLRDRRYTFRLLQPLRDEGRWPEAALFNDRVLQRYPDHGLAIREKGRFLLQLGKEKEAHEWFARAAAAAEGTPLARVELLRELAGTPEFTRELARLRKQFPANPELEFFVHQVHVARGEAKAAETVLRGLLKIDDRETRWKVLYLLRANLERQGRGKEAAGLPEPEPFRELPVTERNYRRLAAMVAKAGATHFVMAYPMRDPTPLRDWVPGAAGVIDNRPDFSLAKRPGAFDDFFTDRFSGDLGHFTPRSMELVAMHAYGVVARWLRESGRCGGPR